MFPRLPTSICFIKQNRSASERVVASARAKCARRFGRIRERGPTMW